MLFDEFTFTPDTTEINKLVSLIREKHPEWPLVRRINNKGEQVCIFGNDGNIKASAVIHYFSYGNEEGLLEFWAGYGTDVVGYLTAEKALKLFEKALKDT